MANEIGLQIKNKQKSVCNEIDRCFYEWSVHKRSESVTINGVILNAKASQ